MTAARTADIVVEMVVQNHPPARTADIVVEMVVHLAPTNWSIGSLRIK